MLTRSDDLDILLMVVDSGGFSAAADALNIQVARVSRAVSKIEQQLGVTILNRTTRRVELTDEGRQFVESVRGGLQQLQRAEDELVRRGELPQGRLRVDAASPFVFHQLVPLMKDFRAAYPDIELALTSNEGYVDLLEKRTDVAIRIGKLADSTLHARPLGKSALHIVASAEYLARRGVPQKVSDLACHELLGFTEPKILNHWPLKGCDVITPTISTSNGETLRQLALAGNGIACLSSFMINDDLAAGRLVPILQSEKFTHIEREQVNAVYYKSSIVARRISAFIEFIQPRLTL
ncbi:LysR family transcriptional regulator [Shewanella frigidimarina]|uniref:Transcriptional regulator, LysR family protein n=1 Tax=Shewanella frigidimarina (strain NCIMB 400) TaxID=318167 RepID=Q089J3_SHEFN|nr:LysR family transcriptional regulator [Shewanella frigidimarina]ABI70072.1 transcriptional regulator, LysR family protein [Shewanella frigidimarina NCIMB 400]|tara:strand:+ start:266 stop:1147 length:882 start_codon:yes stop_codon:yes gene_type:complete